MLFEEFAGHPLLIQGVIPMMMTTSKQTNKQIPSSSMDNPDP